MGFPSLPHKITHQVMLNVYVCFNMLLARVNTGHTWRRTITSRNHLLMHDLLSDTYGPARDVSTVQITLTYSLTSPY